MKKKKKKAADPRRKVRALDPEAWKVFARKAGTMKHRKDKRTAQRLRKELDEGEGGHHL